MTDAKILCLGDLHLGVRPSRLPVAIDPETASVAAVWRRAVDLAIREGVGLVLLSGDVVWEGNPLEPLGPLERELRRLADADIEVCAVGGNHDFDVLPRLSRVLGGERYHFLGAEGRWEPFTWRGSDGRPLLHVHGWSFPEKNVTEDPIERYDLEAPEDGAPVLGLVHGDLDRARSTNAPLSRLSLERAGPAGWVLGHVHKPDLVDLAAGKWALYPGSPQPLDPTEEGAHGAWLLELRDGRLGRPSQVSLATLRWETLEVDLAGVGDLEEATDHLVTAARDAAREIAGDGPSFVHLLLTARLMGRTGAHSALPALVRELEEQPRLVSTADGVKTWIAQVRLHTLPPVDLASLARSDDPPGVLAALLLALEGKEDGPLQDLLDRTTARTREVYGRRHYPPALEEDLEAVGERERLAAAAWRLLDALLAQKPVAREGTGEAAGS